MDTVGWLRAGLVHKSGTLTSFWLDLIAMAMYKCTDWLSIALTLEREP